MLPGDTIFLVSDDRLVEMHSEPFDHEVDLQDLVARYPGLLAGSQMTPGVPRRWMLIRREMGVPSSEGGGDHWSADHLFIDQDAVPTIVEVKRSTDTRIRREVVGQMLDYAANGVVYWPVENLRATHEATCTADGRDPAEELHQLLGADSDPDAFWARVGDHLAAGRVRMVFVADVVPPELQRVVEFLNEGMSRAQVYAVELPQFVAATGQRTLVPRLIGATAAARTGSGRDRGNPGVDALIAAAPDHVRMVDDRLRNWAEQRDIQTTDTAAARAFTVGEASLAKLYPGWSSVEIYLGKIRDAGLVAEADHLQADFEHLCPSKHLTRVSPNLPTEDLAPNWDAVVPVLDRYREVSVAAMQSAKTDAGETPDYRFRHARKVPPSIKAHYGRR